MTDISELSTQQKSALLWRAMGHEWPDDRCPVCGWTYAQSRDKGCVPGDCCQRPPPKPHASEPLNLYDTANMASAWNLFVNAWMKGGEFGESVEAAWDVNERDIICYSADGALKILMDMVLECALEAGLVQLEDADA